MPSISADAPDAAIVLDGVDVRRDLCDLLCVRAWLRDRQTIVPRVVADRTVFFRPGHDDDARAERFLQHFYGPPRSFLSDRRVFGVVIVIANIVDVERLAARHHGFNAEHAEIVQRTLWRQRLVQTRATVIAAARRSASSVAFAYLGRLPGYGEPVIIQQGDSSEIEVFVHDDIPSEAITNPPRPPETPRGTNQSNGRA